jgi:xylulose-5-phosphate/fructose-6-phosphate phosphoketolase
MKKYSTPIEHPQLIAKQLDLLNYIASASLYLKDNFWLSEKLTHDNIKPRILGHWGTVPGLNLIYACANSLIQQTQQNAVFVTGPGHGAPAILANLFLEGSLSSVYPNVTHNRAGLEVLIKGFSWPKQFPSHTYPGLPGSIHEGGELGYSLGTAYGAMLDNPQQMAICVIGDGEAETGALAASWHSNKFYNPIQDGYVLPILHVNGYKISNPTIMSTMSDEELDQYFRGLGYKPIFVSQYTSKEFIKDTCDAMFEAYNTLQELRETWKEGDKCILPVIILRSKKGWTGPKYLHDLKIEDNNYSHGIPLKKPKSDPYELEILDKWLSSYNIKDAFNNNGTINEELLFNIPPKEFRMGENKIAQREDHKPLILPSIELFDEEFKEAGTQDDSELEVFAEYVTKILSNPKNRSKFRIFSPDESESNFLEKIFAQTKKVYSWPLKEWDANFSHTGQFMEILSEQTLMSWMQGYILTGRHGVLVSYEAFLSIIASQIDQYIKFIRQAQDFAWRKSLPSLNFIATSSVWRQDHNGFTHQNPILINTLLAKHVDFVNVYFPSDVNTMLCSMEECFSSSSTVNLIIAGKTQMPQWLNIEQARIQVRDGLSIWEFASNSKDPDVVLTSAGDYMTMESMAGITLVNELCPELKYRYVNVSTLSCQGFGCGSNQCMTDKQICEFYTPDKPVIFNFHGYPEAMKEMLYDTCLAGRTKILGYIEKGTTTTPFDMQVKNNTSRFHIAMYMIEAAATFNPAIKAKSAKLIAIIEAKIAEHKAYIVEVGDDMPEIKNWKWKGSKDSLNFDNSNQ